MRKMLVIAFAAPLLMIGATDPQLSKKPEAAESDTATASAYRPCRPGPGDDRCIQLYERGVRASYANWQRQRRGDQSATQVAMGGPDEGHRTHRRRAHRRHDHRCSDPVSHAGERG